MSCASIERPILQCCVCNDASSGAHECSKCSRPVHIICGSRGDGEEGYGVSLVCNNCSSDVSVDMEEKKARKKTSRKITGYHAFLKNVSGIITEKIDGADLQTISHNASSMWHMLDPEARKDWQRHGQLLREDVDCGIVEYKCPKCQKTFKRDKDMKYHVKNCENCSCEICDKEFVSLTSLKKHMSFHSEKFKCTVCDKICSSQYMLDRHKLTHSDKKMFSCKLCTSAFKTLSNLKRHHRIQH